MKVRRPAREIILKQPKGIVCKKIILGRRVSSYLPSPVEPYACPARRCQHCNHPVVVDPICSSVSGEDATQATARVRRRYSRTACGDPWWGQVERDEDGDDDGGRARGIGRGGRKGREPVKLPWREEPAGRPDWGSQPHAPAHPCRRSSSSYRVRWSLR